MKDKELRSILIETGIIGDDIVCCGLHSLSNRVNVQDLKSIVYQIVNQLGLEIEYKHGYEVTKRKEPSGAGGGDIE